MTRTQSRRRGVVAFVAITVVACCLSACLPVAAPGRPDANVPMRVGLIPVTASAPILVPLDGGEFAARGLDVTVQPVTGTAQAMVSVASGQLDVGNVTMGSAALNAFNRGTDLKIIGAGGAEPTGHGVNLPVIV